MKSTYQPREPLPYLRGLQGERRASQRVRPPPRPFLNENKAHWEFHTFA